MNRKFRKSDLVKYNTSYIIPPSIKYEVEHGLIGKVIRYEGRNVIVKWNKQRIAEVWDQKFLKKVK